MWWQCQIAVKTSPFTQEPHTAAHMCVHLGGPGLRDCHSGAEGSKPYRYWLPATAGGRVELAPRGGSHWGCRCPLPLPEMPQTELSLTDGL